MVGNSDCMSGVRMPSRVLGVGVKLVARLDILYIHESLLALTLTIASKLSEPPKPLLFCRIIRRGI